MTLLAGFVTAYHHARLGAECSLLELDGQILAQIGAALNPAASPSAASEGISEAEEFAENVAQILKGRSVEARAGPGPTDAGMTETIVERTFLRISQNSVSLSNFLETLFRVRVIRVPIGMPLHGKFAISALQFNFAYSAGHPKHFVVIAFCVCGQNRRLSLIRTMWITTGLETYLPELLATFTIAGRSSRSLNL